MKRRDGHTLEIFIDGDEYRPFRGTIACQFPKPHAATDPETWPACWQRRNEDGSINELWTKDGELCLVQEWYDLADNLWGPEVDSFPVTQVPVPIEWWHENEMMMIAPYTENVIDYYEAAATVTFSPRDSGDVLPWLSGDDPGHLQDRNGLVNLLNLMIGEPGAVKVKQRP